MEHVTHQAIACRCSPAALRDILARLERWSSVQESMCVVYSFCCTEYGALEMLYLRVTTLCMQAVVFTTAVCSSEWGPRIQMRADTALHRDWC